MIEASQAIRKSFYQALNTLIYNGKDVPVYDDSGDEAEGKFQVYLTNQDQVNADNKHEFVGQHSIVIDIVTKFENAPNKKVADEISQLVTSIIQPTRNTTGLSTTGYQLINLQLSSVGYLSEGSKGNFLVRKLLTYRFKIVHN